MSVIFRPNILENEVIGDPLQPPKEILDILPETLRSLFINAWKSNKDIEEIRLRKKQPLIIRMSKTELIFEDFVVSKELIDSLLRIISKNSLYALENELRSGFITIRGGHRVGFVGEVVLEAEHIRTQKNIASINIRIARAVEGCANDVLPNIINKKNNSIFHTLIVSPPRCGKTTLLRDVVRFISKGCKYITPMQVGLVDERSEIAGCFLGTPQLDVGPRTDVLDRCPKAQGMIILIRSMGPDVIATDELGGSKDVDAVRQVINAGIKFLATVHGDDFAQLCKRPYLKELINMQVFQRYVFLNKFGTGPWIKEVLDVNGKKLISNIGANGAEQNA